MMAVLDVEVLCGGKPVLRYVQAGRAVPEYDEPFSIFIRSGRNSPSKMLKIAVFAPIPMANAFAAG
jgi:hypothetical protein